MRNSKNVCLRTWVTLELLKKTIFKDFNELKKVFNSVNQVGIFTVFNFSGNRFRLIAAIHFNRQKVFVRNILSHSEYDKGKW
ncbi:type II toxin-antitoxin system HigB family toxin [Leptospira biflexa]|uniref:type II toxin-antitoxin system HigB family toxin n=1 Tax=Leptospira biflexa TaxID=172 RepID=UPI0009D65D85|nr:type II toxin-antitoxin system HigB family toxin [Leptospira biflexa]TGM44499.1 type II toxin-antitoxin system HigB family toxin [Leptospira biflexa]